MKRYSLLAVTLILMIAAACRPSSEIEKSHGVTLFDKRTQPIIVIASSATAAESFAAKELQSYLKKITGHNPVLTTVVTQTVGPLIILGGHSLNDDLDWKSLGPDDFIIDVSSGRVRIAGGRSVAVTDRKGGVYVQERGTLYGVYELLEQLGVRWYRPDPWGEYVPQSDKIQLAVNRKTYRPAYKYRYGMGCYRWWKDETPEQHAMACLWATRNRQNCNMGTGPEYGGYYQINFAHSYSDLVPPERFFASHPEYFALIGGKRSDKPNAQLCLSNPDVQRIVAGAVIAQAKANPQQEILSVEPNDFGLWCECDACKAMDDPKLPASFGGISMANRVCAFNNIIARKLAEQVPQAKIGWFAYNMHTEVPTRVTKLEPNAAVQAAAYAGAYSDYSRQLDDSASMQNNHFLQILRGYGRLTQMMMTYEYWSGYCWFGPLPVVHTMVDRLRAYRHLGVVGVYNETHPHWGPQGLTLYMCCKLMWNPDLDVQEELDLYYTNYYGPAAAMMKAYHEMLEAAATNGRYFGSGGSELEKLFTDDLVNQLRPPIEQAQQAVRGIQPYEKRLAGVVAGYEVARRIRQFFNLSNAGRVKEAAACFDDLEKYILSFKEGDVFDNGPIIYPSIVSFMREWKKSLMSQEILLTTFRDPKVVQTHDKKWRFQTDPKDEGLAAGWMKPELDAASWSLLDVDQWWQVQGYPTYHGVAWYRRQFQPPGHEGSQRIVLYFGAVDGDSTVFVNGRKVGEHILSSDGVGWDKPFYFDITDYLENGKPNLMAVRVHKGVAMSGIFKGVKILNADKVEAKAK